MGQFILYTVYWSFITNLTYQFFYHKILLLCIIITEKRMNRIKYNYNKPIPSKRFPNHNVQYKLTDDPIIVLTDISDYTHYKDRIIYDPVYFNMQLPYATDCCKMRLRTAKLLFKALDLLPSQYGFKIFDAWRPFKLQEAIYYAYRETIASKYFNKSSEEIDSIVNEYVSIPINDHKTPPVHTTGGSIDLTIFLLDDGCELNMGTNFDFFGEMSNTSYFENNIPDSDNNSYIEILKNRRLLYNTMTIAGFSNLPSEWWHYDYGNSYWASSTNNKAMYEGVFEL